MDTLSYFATQSAFTDPGDYGSLFADLPKTIPEICQVIQGVFLDYRERYKYPIVNERLLDTNSRYVKAVLKAVLALDKSPLTTARPEENRFTATCSDYANLFCSILRYQGVPARKRVGFVDCNSWEIVEYWDGSAWKQIDPSGLTEGTFVSAAEAWQACRSGKTDPAPFAGDSNAKLKGMDILRTNLMLDLAAMMKAELLNWDRYGWMMRPLEDFSDKAWEILDKAAELLLAADQDLDAVSALYEAQEGLQVPRVIRCDSPVAPPHKVELTF